MRSLIRFAALAVVWFLWSGHTEPLIVGFGALSVGLVTALWARMDRLDGGEPPYALGLRPLTYLPYLLWEIVLSNLHVAKTILSPSLPVQPQLVRVNVTQKTVLGQVVHANSITLTPGTITLDVRDGSFLVHALTDHTAAGVLSGDMDARVTALEGAS
jgi:multicomponent Na+:H+ antiporter subunit E